MPFAFERDRCGLVVRGFFVKGGCARTAVQLLLLVFSLARFSSAEMVFERGASWRWRAGTTEASEPISAWREANFNDAEFATGAAPFWYGDAYPGGTVITGMQNVYGCVFLRKTFVITNVAEVASLQFGAIV